MIREFRIEDIKEIKRIHDKFYKDQFPFPDFFEHFICAFTVLENDKIVLSGGVKTILEAVAVTDKDNPVRLRREGLYDLLTACTFTANRSGYNQIHTTVINDLRWQNHLEKIGFNPVNGQVLVLEMNNER